MVETKQQTTDWPFFTVCGPEVPCTCGGCKFERLGDAWQCEECGALAQEGAVVASEPGDKRLAETI